MKIVELFDGSLFECQMSKNLLENEGIESFLKDQIIGLRSIGCKPTGGVKVMVLEDNLEKAITIVKEFEHSRQEK